MDFLARFPAECLEDISHHLSAADLLACTLVCPSWNQTISSTRSCTEKIKLWCSEPVCIDQMINILRNSKRKYSCITVDRGYSEDVEKLLSLERKTWTRVVSYLRFRTVGDFLRFLSVMQQTRIQKLVLNSGEIGKVYKIEKRCRLAQFFPFYQELFRNRVELQSEQLNVPDYKLYNLQFA